MAKNSLKTMEAALRQWALAYPEATEDFPWGHVAIKVKGKVFLFMCLEGQELSLSVKLPVSGQVALQLPFASPTRYGLGKSGWVTAQITAKQVVPVEMLQEWIDESYRAIAPKKLVAELEDTDTEREMRPRARKKAPKRK